jgi:acyl-CoA thioester hydrolase
VTLSGYTVDGKHNFQLRVYYEDTDFSGLVYHANYLKFCERARSDWLRILGVDQTSMSAGSAHFVVRRIVCDFLKAAKFDDILTIESNAVELKGARFEMAQRILRGAELVFTADVTVAIVDNRGKPMRVSTELAEKFQVATQPAP